MISKHKAILVDWYSRVVFGVIALSLAMLAGQGACSMEPVARAVRTMRVTGSTVLCSDPGS